MPARSASRCSSPGWRKQPGSRAKTYGYLRWEILAALINGATLLCISVWIVVEAILRFRHPEPVAGAD